MLFPHTGLQAPASVHNTLHGPHSRGRQEVEQSPPDIDAASIAPCRCRYPSPLALSCVLYSCGSSNTGFKRLKVALEFREIVIEQSEFVNMHVSAGAKKATFKSCMLSFCKRCQIHLCYVCSRNFSDNFLALRGFLGS